MLIRITKPQDGEKETINTHYILRIIERSPLKIGNKEYTHIIYFVNNYKVLVERKVGEAIEKAMNVIDERFLLDQE